MSIPTIFEIEGEAGFRDREEAVLADLTALANVVLSTGGGAVLRPGNRERLKDNGTVIYLHASRRRCGSASATAATGRCCRPPTRSRAWPSSTRRATRSTARPRRYVVESDRGEVMRLVRMFEAAGPPSDMHRSA